VLSDTLLLGGNVNTNGKYISGDGDDEGIYVDASGNVGLNGVPSAYNLDVGEGRTVRSGTLVIDPSGSGGVSIIRAADTLGVWGLYAGTSASNSGSYLALYGYDATRSGEINYLGNYHLWNTGKTIGTFGSSAMKLTSDGNLGVGELSPTAKLHIDGATGYDLLRLEDSYTPTSSADGNGNTGDIAWDVNYIYVKTGSGWKRSALSTF